MTATGWQACRGNPAPTYPKGPLCRHCGARMSVPEDQHDGAHTMCREKAENR